MKKLLGIMVLGLLLSSNAYAKTYKTASWSHSADSAYNDCGFTGFICSMTMDAKAHKTSTRVGDYLTIYDKNKKQIDEFKVKKIHYQNGQCWITPQPIRKYKTYFVTYNCKVK